MIIIRIVLCTILPIQSVFLVIDKISCFFAEMTKLTFSASAPAHLFVFLDFASSVSLQLQQHVTTPELLVLICPTTHVHRYCVCVTFVTN